MNKCTAVENGLFNSRESSLAEIEAALEEIFNEREVNTRQFRVHEALNEALTRELESTVERLNVESLNLIPQEQAFDTERALELLRQTPTQIVNSAEPDTTTTYYTALPRLSGESDVDYLDRLSTQEEN